MARKLTKEAMKKAKELEAISVPSRSEIREIHKKELEKMKKLRNLLEPEWFIKDVHKKKAAMKKKAAAAKKKAR